MCFDALGCHFLTSVPNFQFLVITYRCEFILIMMIPANVFNNLWMSINHKKWVECFLQLVLLVYVPEADFTIVTAREELASLLWIPVKTISLASMSKKYEFWFDLISGWTNSMFEVVENVYISWCCFCSDDLVCLWHVSGSVYLTLMIDLHFDLNAFIFRNPNATLCRCALSSIACLNWRHFVLTWFIQSFSVFPSVLWWLLWHFHFNNLQVVLFIIWSVSSNQQPLNGPITVKWPMK